MGVMGSEPRSLSPIMVRTPPKRVSIAVAVFFLIATVIWLQPSSVSAISARASSRDHDKHLDEINNSTLGFGKIFAIGLPSRTDHRDRMVLQAALSNMSIEFVDGVLGKDIVDKAIPMKGDNRMSDAPLGTWRAHMDAIRLIVEQDLASALIMEDDVDWDVRLKEQLRDFALSTRTLLQPLASVPGAYADPTYPRTGAGALDAVTEIQFDQMPATVAPTTSPYGDNWDVLWMGHCGMHFPFDNNKALPKGRVVRYNDKTVAPKANLWSYTTPFTLKEQYPEHTRVVHHAQEGVCMSGYAVSQRGARKILRDIALMEPTDGVDILLRFFCEGTHGRDNHTCVTTQPGIVQQHKPAGPMKSLSDIGDPPAGYKEKSTTDMIRWSVALNEDVLLDGRNDFRDQFPEPSK